MLIRQVYLKSALLVTIDIFYIKGLRFKRLSVTGVIMC